MRISRFYYKDGRRFDQEAVAGLPAGYLQRPDIDGDTYVQHSFRHRSGEPRDIEIIEYDEMIWG